MWTYIANREQTAARDYTQETAEATQAAHECLEDIRTELTEGGEC